MSNNVKPAFDCTGPSSCSVCVHGHDLEPWAGSPVVCTPQKKAHPHDYCCTGFRLVTAVELDERTAAKFGKPNAQGDSLPPGKDTDGH